MVFLGLLDHITEFFFEFELSLKGLCCCGNLINAFNISNESHFYTIFLNRGVTKIHLIIENVNTYQFQLLFLTNIDYF